ncbi:flavin reductase family protein [bacterium]|nr:flavin reductase family protein [bacterium]MBU1614585.1 flavin reductase family protein [bacterium]
MELELSNWYKILAPRSTVLISTMNKEGRPNAAPFSFCMPVSSKPPLVAFSSAPKRHTLSNIRATKEFILNLPGEKMLSGLWICAKPFAPGINEIEEAGLTEEKGKKVSVPRIKEAFGWIECLFKSEIEAGDHFIVIGEVVFAEIKEEGCLCKTGNLDLKKVSPLLHLGGNEFGLAKSVVRI